jgi:hypothetical protein
MEYQALDITRGCLVRSKEKKFTVLGKDPVII